MDSKYSTIWNLENIEKLLITEDGSEQLIELLPTILHVIYRHGGSERSELIMDIQKETYIKIFTSLCIKYNKLTVLYKFYWTITHLLLYPSYPVIGKFSKCNIRCQTLAVYETLKNAGFPADIDIQFATNYVLLNSCNVRHYLNDFIDMSIAEHNITIFTRLLDIIYDIEYDKDEIMKHTNRHRLKDTWIDWINKCVTYNFVDGVILLNKEEYKYIACNGKIFDSSRLCHRKKIISLIKSNSNDSTRVLALYL